MKWKNSLIVGGVSLLVSPLLLGQANKLYVTSDGTVHLPEQQIPFSALASKEAQAEFVRHANVKVMENSDQRADANDIRAQRRQLEQEVLPLLELQRKRYAVSIQPMKLGGVNTEIVVPADGIGPVNVNRILISLHGGGFEVGGGIRARQWAIPIAAVGKIKVVSVDYRMSPEYGFPAASEDVAAVYRELLKQYDPRSIGIYGCSAGGILTAQAISWFLKAELPVPGAIGMFGGSGREVIGDSTNNLLSGGAGEGGYAFHQFPYFRGVDVESPLVVPLQYKDIATRFPASLLITGSRAFEMSSIIDANNKLTMAGVDTHLNIWDGLGHCFIANSELPESREAYEVITRFFSSHLK